MDKTEVALNQAYRLLNPGCVVLVSVGDGERDNLLAITWNMPVRKSPPLVALLSGKGHYSYPFMAATGELGISIMTARWVDAVLGCGSTTGSREPDKFGRFGLTRQAAQSIKAPLVAEAVATLECRICQVVDLGASALLIAGVLHAAAAPEHFKHGRWCFDSGLELIHHLGGDRFSVADRAVRGSPPTPG